MKPILHVVILIWSLLRGEAHVIHALEYRAARCDLVDDGDDAILHTGVVRVRRGVGDCRVVISTPVFVEDIIRTVLQTAVASRVPVHEYLMSVLRANPDDVAGHPERFTPLAYATRVPSK